MSEIVYCNNCGKLGHLYHQCKLPITSYGIIAFKKDNNNNIYFLMIRRKDTLGYVDFIRGKYSLHNLGFIMNMLEEMTLKEKHNICNLEFETLWSNLWGSNSKIGSYQKMEEKSSSDKLKQLKDGLNIKNNVTIKLSNIVKETKYNWSEPEWGFPKGRRNHLETDLDCALREWQEETGYDKSNIQIIQNLIPFDEVFTGSNYKSYKHKYYVAWFKSDNFSCNSYERNEVGKMEWKKIDDALKCIRPYNIERIELIKKIHFILSEHIIY